MSGTRSWFRPCSLPVPDRRGVTVSDNSAIEWTDATWNPVLLDQPLRWSRPRRIFVNSQSDLFHPDVPDTFIDQIFSVMARASQHTFQVLTKRPDRMAKYLSDLATQRRVADAICAICQGGRLCRQSNDDCGLDGPEWPLPNVWLGVSE
ncbi:MAG: DUF5131 family protein [Thermoleophilia bacterium]|nr:DUF5131 family protein [Thermoleophilia bacterium]